MESETLNGKVMKGEEEDNCVLMAEVVQRKRRRFQESKEKSAMTITDHPPYRLGDRVNVKHLLSNQSRDYLINNKGVKFPVCHLEDKVVALYFYEHGITDGFTDESTTNLRDAYKQLVSVEKKSFEVVLVYLYHTWNTDGRTDANSFNRTFQTMPWLALPYKDRNCVELARIFRYPFELDEWHPDPSLVIIGPRGDFVVPFGAAPILRTFGAPAYPFTRQKVYKLLVELVKGLKLETLWHPESIFVRGCLSKTSSSQEVVVPFADIVGKRIIVICERVTNKWQQFRVKLLEKYKETKGGSDEFEVIYFQGGRSGRVVPWLIPSPCCVYTMDILSRVFDYGYGVLFFDADGRIVRATSNPGFEDDVFPFYAGSIEEEVRTDLITRFEWEDGDVIYNSN